MQIITRLAVAALGLSLVGCSANSQSSTADNNERVTKYGTIEELRDAFVHAGGQCWEWKKSEAAELAQMRLKAHADCDKMTVLILYENAEETRAGALSLAKLERDMGFKLHILFGENWMINSDQINLVRKVMGGTVITR